MIIRITLYTKLLHLYICDSILLIGMFYKHLFICSYIYQNVGTLSLLNYSQNIILPKYRNYVPFLKL